MPSLERTRSARFIDAGWRMALRIGFRLARVWWRLRRPSHEGALVAVYVGRSLLLLKSSYRAEWNFPGGGVGPGESPEIAAQREMEEEIGLSSHPLIPAGSVSGIWDGRRDRVHFFELHLDSMPELRLDHREIVAAHLASPEELSGFAVTDAVAAYLGRGRRD
ncbi:NUDIX domain-containing protein [Burkholderia stagnalis]|uniref:NUDIX domain-containing protein n=1 Tax=Burkholderia stagnalis TaxID=1503054 RepID=UPI00075AE3EF|nr:NUDIX hydrolase [Burkholderia stagnalis]KVC61448.1 NUDIX hydrolase [Burkholderia stagnalis]KVN20372.1 NUDIX hydrolase [Burkholderia stagnalis]KWI71688.1 NUDIX hydrolase [Burkholderia stagnalis]KWK72727.1 NUDIX hydrolase [Burkholderia stagnalis]KWN10583.1 NUDIX hydrolase [Burkholderia stagnalis]